MAILTNPCLFKFKEKALDNCFDIKYIAGIHNYADLLARNPVDKPDLEDIEESQQINVLMSNMTTLSLEAVLVTPATIKI